MQEEKKKLQAILYFSSPNTQGQFFIVGENGEGVNDIVTASISSLNKTLAERLDLNLSEEDINNIVIDENNQVKSPIFSGVILPMEGNEKVEHCVYIPSTNELFLHKHKDGFILDCIKYFYVHFKDAHDAINNSADADELIKDVQGDIDNNICAHVFTVNDNVAVIATHLSNLRTVSTEDLINDKVSTNEYSISRLF